MTTMQDTTEAPGDVRALEAEAAAVQARLVAAREREAAEARRSIEERSAPLRQQVADLERAIADVDARAHAVLCDAVARGRELYRELCELTAQRRAVRGQIQAITGVGLADYPAPPFGAFARGVVARFNAEGNGAWMQEGGAR